MLNPKFSILALALLGAGCMTNDNATDLIGTAAVPVPVTEIAGNHSIFVATTREASPDAKVFSNSRSPKLNFARVNVTIPKEHKTGQIERNKPGKPDDPLQFFTATEVVAFDAQPQFSGALSADIAARGGRAMIFIHGYNTSFDSAVYRATQIAHDSGYPGTPVLFSWASGGSTTDYVYDRESASVARDQLEATLRLLAQSGARRIDIVAHSMGTWVTMEALRQLAITGDRDLDGKLGDVVLASPDIDVDVFKSQMRRYGKPEKPFILLLSADDLGAETVRHHRRQQAAGWRLQGCRRPRRIRRGSRRPVEGKGHGQPQPHQVCRQSGAGEAAWTAPARTTAMPATAM